MTEIDRALEEGSLALVGEFSSLRVANEYALVVLAMNLDCWLRMEAQGPCYALYAEAPFQVAIEEEFRLYTEEQSLPAERRLEIPLYGSGIELFLLWAMALVFVFMNQTEAMVEDYCSSSLGIFERGEWYRPITSLFLHFLYHGINLDNILPRQTPSLIFVEKHFAHLLQILKADLLMSRPSLLGTLQA